MQSRRRCGRRDAAKKRTLGQASLSASRLAKNSRAGAAENDSLGVREDGGDGEAAGLT